MTSYEEAREIDRRLNASPDPTEMRALITRRRLIRAGLAFEQAIEQVELDHPTGPVGSAYLTIEEWRRSAASDRPPARSDRSGGRPARSGPTDPTR